jgi:hypothetical protein
VAVAGFTSRKSGGSLAMLAEILVLTMAAAPQAAAATPPAPAAATTPASEPGDKTVSPVVVSPLAKPPPADLQIQAAGSEDDPDPADAFWPATAYNGGVNGVARLRCLIDVHGLAERCEVASETPEGKGFGRAAMELRATFKLPPSLGPDGPINAVKIIAVTFKAPDRNFDMAAILSGTTFHQGNPLRMNKVVMLDYPVWVRAANFDDLARAYPAQGDGEEGYAVAHCAVRRTGALDGCVVIKETPEKHGFGKAALALAPKFQVDPRLAQTHHSDPLMVNVPIRFPGREELARRTVMAPAWVTGFDTHKSIRLFPPEAAANGLTTGRGVARCTVTTEGTLTNCAPEAGDPDGEGFSEAAVKLASTMKMNLWGADGAPVEGGVVHIPIRQNLKAGVD